MVYRDAGMFVNETLSGYDGIMFVLNSGDGQYTTYVVVHCLLTALPT